MLFLSYYVYSGCLLLIDPHTELSRPSQAEWQLDSATT